MKPLRENYRYPQETLGFHYLMSKVLFGDESDATQFLIRKADEAPAGWDEVVLAPEEQVVGLLGELHLQWMERTGWVPPWQRTLDER